MVMWFMSPSTISYRQTNQSMDLQVKSIILALTPLIRKNEIKEVRIKYQVKCFLLILACLRPLKTHMNVI